MKNKKNVLIVLFITIGFLSSMIPIGKTKEQVILEAFFSDVEDHFGMIVEDQTPLEIIHGNTYRIGYTNWSGHTNRLNTAYIRYNIPPGYIYDGIVFSTGTYINASLTLLVGNPSDFNCYGLSNITFPMNISLVNNTWDVGFTPGYIDKIPEYLNKSIIVNVTAINGEWTNHTIDLTEFLNGTKYFALRFSPVLDNCSVTIMSPDMFEEKYRPKIIVEINPKELPERTASYYSSLNVNNSKLVQFTKHHLFSFNITYELVSFSLDWDCSKSPYYIDIIIRFFSEENYQKYLNNESYNEWDFYNPYTSGIGSQYNRAFMNGGASTNLKNGTYYVLFINLDTDNETANINYNINIDVEDITPDPEPEPEIEPDTTPELEPSIPGYSLLIICVISIISIVYIISKVKYRKNNF